MNVVAAIGVYMRAMGYDHFVGCETLGIVANLSLTRRLLIVEHALQKEKI